MSVRGYLCQQSVLQARPRARVNVKHVCIGQQTVVIATAGNNHEIVNDAGAVAAHGFGRCSVHLWTVLFEHFLRRPQFCPFIMRMQTDEVAQVSPRVLLATISSINPHFVLVENGCVLAPRAWSIVDVHLRA